MVVFKYLHYRYFAIVATCGDVATTCPPLRLSTGNVQVSLTLARQCARKQMGRPISRNVKSQKFLALLIMLSCPFHPRLIHILSHIFLGLHLIQWRLMITSVSLYPPQLPRLLSRIPQHLIFTLPCDLRPCSACIKTGLVQMQHLDCPAKGYIYSLV